MADVAEHEEKRQLTEIVIDPNHAARTESPEFARNRKRLQEDGHFRCYVCGSTTDLEAHHHGCEWSLSAVCDYAKLKAYCEEFDPYGYGRLLRNVPITSPDDIRNLLVLCRVHHLSVDKEDGGGGTGVHDLTYPIFIIQKVAKDGENPVPQPGQTIEDVEKEIAGG